MIENPELKRRILEISYNNRLSHLGSCLTAVDIIYEIFQQKQPEERFVLSSGHAGVALYTVLEAMGGRNAEEIFEHHGVHPDRCIDCGIDCSSGSLGQGLPISVGMALANRRKNVYCLISDGETAEGSIWEALRIAYEQKLDNLHIYLNANWYGAYSEINPYKLQKRVEAFGFPVDVRISRLYSSVLNGQDAHYKVLNEKEYKTLMQEYMVDTEDHIMQSFRGGS